MCISRSFFAPLSHCYYLRQVLDLLRFMSAGQFLNMAHIHPNLLTKSSPVHWAAKNTLTVGLMGITIQESHLRTPSSLGNTSHDVFKITGYSFPQEWCRDASMWAMLLGFQDMEIVGPVGPKGVSFHTRTPAKVSGLMNPSAFLSSLVTNFLTLYQM